MVLKEFMPPWLVKQTVVCPKCGWRGEVLPIWPWQKEPEEIRKLQLHFCHILDPKFLEIIPVLTDNDWKSKQRMDEFMEYLKERWSSKPEAEKLVLNMSEVFQKHGIIALICLALGPIVREVDLKAISLFLCDETRYFTQVDLQKMLNASKSYVSAILKRLLAWKFVVAYKTSAKGRAKGRQLVYKMDPEARRLLDKDLTEHDFFRQAVVQVVRPIAEAFSGANWRWNILSPERAHVADKQPKHVEEAE